jgi:hypothetical protein
MSNPLPFESATPRFDLPMLFAGQSQKEFYVNEALLRTDLLLHCAVESRRTSPPTAPVPGQAWLVGENPTEAFAGHEHKIAAWTEGGWRFFAPRPGLRVFDLSLSAFHLFVSGAWQEPGSIAAPEGGSTVDTQARTAVAALISKLVSAGILRE